MCWSSKIKPVLLIAGKDIPVKKILLHQGTNDYVSPCYKQFGWNINKVHTTKLGEPIVHPLSYDISQGFHSCEDIIALDVFWATGFHIIFERDYDEVVVSAIIPKGSEYYKNEFGEYVSNKLKICVG